MWLWFVSMGYNEEHRCLTKRKSTERDRSGSESEKAGKDKKCDCVECEERERENSDGIL